MKWEYTVRFIAPSDWNECSSEKSLELLQLLGLGDWELVTIYGGLGFFKRPKEDYGEEEAVKEAHSEEDTSKPQRCSAAGELYSRAYAFDDYDEHRSQ